MAAITSQMRNRGMQMTVVFILLVIPILSSCDRTKQPNAQQWEHVQESSLTLQAGLVFASGVRPVARTTFYVLDADVVDVIQQSVELWKNSTRGCRPEQIRKYPIRGDQKVRRQDFAT